MTHADSSFLADLEVRPVSAAIGATIGGIDLSAALGNEAVVAIGTLLDRHRVLFFEDQTLTPRQQRDFAARFGALHVHPLYPHDSEVEEIIVLDTHADNPPDNDNWHTDVTFIETPPMGSVLYARQIPAVGGDTLWSNMVAAHAGLSARLQRFLDGLTASHDFAKSFPPDRFAGPAEQAQWQQTRARHPPVIHPVVRTHPTTGEKCLFVNSGFTTHIVDLPRPESDAVLNLLFQQVAKPEFTCRHRWRVDDVAFWDNRCTQHYALADYLPHRRVMHRATIIGERPV
jgi:taurine dioxygenase